MNTSARNIKNKKKVKYFKKFIKNSDLYNNYDSLIAGIITPDRDIVPNSKRLKPAYLVFGNYERVLKWNRSLRFALAVCTLKTNLKMKFKLIFILLFITNCTAYNSNVYQKNV